MDEEAVAQFASFTSSTFQMAEQYLRLTDGDIQQAIDLFFANDGNDANDSTSAAPRQPASQPPPQLHNQAGTSQRRRGFEDADGVVHIDSDQDFTDDDELQFTESRVRPKQVTRSGKSRSDAQTPSSMTPPTRPVAHSVDDDEAMARRLQEEFYGGTGPASDVGPDGVRAPLARTTETLIDPDSFDTPGRDEMRNAVLEQMRVRERFRQRGIYPSSANRGP